MSSMKNGRPHPRVRTASWTFVMLACQYNGVMNNFESLIDLSVKTQRFSI